VPNSVVRAEAQLCSHMHLHDQYCLVAAGPRFLPHRWTLLIVRELLADVRHFNELVRGLPAGALVSRGADHPAVLRSL
jgi:DNA-binding HxlR family transcriptional regulator